jgi:hypothetical protein
MTNRNLKLARNPQMVHLLLLAEHEHERAEQREQDRLIDNLRDIVRREQRAEPIGEMP